MNDEELEAFLARFSDDDDVATDIGVKTGDTATEKEDADEGTADAPYGFIADDAGHLINSSTHQTLQEELDARAKRIDELQQALAQSAEAVETEKVQAAYNLGMAREELDQANQRADIAMKREFRASEETQRAEMRIQELRETIKQQKREAQAYRDELEKCREQLKGVKDQLQLTSEERHALSRGFMATAETNARAQEYMKGELDRALQSLAEMTERATRAESEARESRADLKELQSLYERVLQENREQQETAPAIVALDDSGRSVDTSDEPVTDDTGQPIPQQPKKSRRTAAASATPATLPKKKKRITPTLLAVPPESLPMASPPPSKQPKKQGTKRKAAAGGSSKLPSPLVMLTRKKRLADAAEAMRALHASMPTNVPDAARPTDNPNVRKVAEDVYNGLLVNWNFEARFTQTVPEELRARLENRKQVSHSTLDKILRTITLPALTFVKGDDVGERFTELTANPDLDQTLRRYVEHSLYVRALRGESATMQDLETLLATACQFLLKVRQLMNHGRTRKKFTTGAEVEVDIADVFKTRGTVINEGPERVTAESGKYAIELTRLTVELSESSPALLTTYFDGVRPPLYDPDALQKVKQSFPAKSVVAAWSEQRKFGRLFGALDAAYENEESLVSLLQRQLAPTLRFDATNDQYVDESTQPPTPYSFFPYTETLESGEEVSGELLQPAALGDELSEEAQEFTTVQAADDAIYALLPALSDREVRESGLHERYAAFRYETWDRKIELLSACRTSKLAGMTPGQWRDFLIDEKVEAAVPQDTRTFEELQRQSVHQDLMLMIGYDAALSQYGEVFEAQYDALEEQLQSADARAQLWARLDQGVTFDGTTDKRTRRLLQAALVSENASVNTLEVLSDVMMFIVFRATLPLTAIPSDALYYFVRHEIDNRTEAAQIRAAEAMQALSAAAKTLPSASSSEEEDDEDDEDDENYVDDDEDEIEDDDDGFVDDDDDDDSGAAASSSSSSPSSSSLSLAIDDQGPFTAAPPRFDEESMGSSYIGAFNDDRQAARDATTDLTLYVHEFGTRGIGVHVSNFLVDPQTFRMHNEMRVSRKHFVLDSLQASTEDDVDVMATARFPSIPSAARSTQVIVTRYQSGVPQPLEVEGTLVATEDTDEDHINVWGLPVGANRNERVSLWSFDRSNDNVLVRYPIQPTIQGALRFEIEFDRPDVMHLQYNLTPNTLQTQLVAQVTSSAVLEVRVVLTNHAPFTVSADRVTLHFWPQQIMQYEAARSDEPSYQRMAKRELSMAASSTPQRHEATTLMKSTTRKAQAFTAILNGGEPIKLHPGHTAYALVWRIALSNSVLVGYLDSANPLRADARLYRLVAPVKNDAAAGLFEMACTDRSIQDMTSGPGLLYGTRRLDTDAFPLAEAFSANNSDDAPHDDRSYVPILFMDAAPFAVISSHHKEEDATQPNVKTHKVTMRVLEPFATQGHEIVLAVRNMQGPPTADEASGVSVQRAPISDRQALLSGDNTDLSSTAHVVVHPSKDRGSWPDEFTLTYRTLA